MFGARDWNFDAFWARSKERLSVALSPPSSPLREEEEETTGEELEGPKSKRLRGNYQ
ncbi:Hypothetical protein FKW44_001681 [Caligus rogercresseyi]|uniref:Uncharacterized protein n=1 Tax=Caligus rogercresseyi TaxID=217165 RepID=A0A7T8KJ28_CALRO|nr:Hypothetical protein FKW44_001681 [Caligus rogercresseyi]